jgi:hypothetical protein
MKGKQQFSCTERENENSESESRAEERKVIFRESERETFVKADNDVIFVVKKVEKR